MNQVVCPISSSDQSASSQHDRQVLLATQAALLQPLGREVIMNLLQHARFRVAEFARGSTIHFEGDACQNLEIILEGQVVIDRIDAEGNLMTVAQSYRHEVLGGNLLFSQRPFYPMTLSAVRSTTLLLIDKDTLLDLLSQNPTFLRIYLELTSDRANMLGDQIRHYVNKSIRMCLASFIKQEYDRQQTNPITLSLSKKKFAEKIGVQRTSISRELAKMRREGLIHYDRRVITILDMQMLD